MTQSPTDHVTWLTQDAYERLQGELDQLSGPGRVELAKKIEAAREEGDLKENGGYHAAKEEQGKQEARIRQLTELLRHAASGAPASGGKAGWLSLCTVRFGGDPDTEQFVLGSREEHLDGPEVYSPESPAISRLPSRKRISLPATEALTTVPVATTSGAAAAWPTSAVRRRTVSWRMRASILPCSSLAAW